MRLLDRLTGARDPERADFATSFAAVFGTPNAERITPDWRNAVNAYKGLGRRVRRRVGPDQPVCTSAIQVPAQGGQEPGVMSG